MAMPLNILEKSVGKHVSVILKDGRSLEGKLAGFDEYMNMVMEETEETKDQQTRRLGTVILRGNNLVAIVPK